MEQCPTCKAKYTGKPVCHRCGTPLERLTDIERRAEEHLESALAAFEAKKFGQMFFHAKRADSLRRTPRSARMLACAAMLVKRFDLALSSRESL